ncbi:MAG: hypothetical protein KBF96_02400 [Ignavibacteria bacterium]|jgi:photosystem II stability/assembly factor-like uncharacterized protein|nr:hypothetical protein [Ignavibacteria bacterium]
MNKTNNKMMKKINLTVLVILLFITNLELFSQQSDNWMWLNPKPQGNTIYAMDFADNNTGYAAGDYGTVLKTIDNGVEWTKLNMAISDKLLSIDFVNSNTGYAGGEDQLLIKTTDGGLTWTHLTLPSAPDFSLYDIEFINANTGYVLGFFIFNSTIWKTTDGGQSWTTQTTGGANYLNNLYFLDASTGFASGGSLGGEVVKTTNGGTTWNMVYTDNYKKQSMVFLNSMTGFCGSEEGRIYKTTDAGNSWNFVLSDGAIDITSMNFINANTGFGFGSGSVYVKTTDGGDNWYQSDYIGSSTSSQYFDAAVTPGGTIHAAGTYGAMVRSTNSGIDFTYKASVTDGYVSDIEFINTTTGYAVTGYNHGDILKTTDAGTSWTSQITSYTTPIYGISFTSAETGYLAGSISLYKTTNGGAIWNTVYNSTTNEIFTDIVFTNVNTGYAIGSYGRQMKTTNAGSTWTPTAISSSGSLLSSICFANDNLGFAVGDNNTAVRTTNAGVNWNSMSVASPFVNLSNVFFTDISNGYISSTTGIYRTTNGGNSWILLNTPSGGYAKVQFRGDFGYAIAGNGKIIKSTDAGTSWIVQPTVTVNGLSALYFNTDDFIYAGGLLGTIIKTIPTELMRVNTVLDLTAFIDGLYNTSANTMISDTLNVFLRNSSAPYSIVDSSKGILSTSGNGSFSFSNVPSGQYYIVLTHRNSIETWSRQGGEVFTAGINISYNMSDQITKAFGNNLKQVDTSPIRFADYSGDINQDGNVDLTDIVNINNNATVFQAGYVLSDLNGDNITDLTDLLIGINNAAVYAVRVTP